MVCGIPLLCDERFLYPAEKPKLNKTMLMLNFSQISSSLAWLLHHVRQHAYQRVPPE